MTLSSIAPSHSALSLVELAQQTRASARLLGTLPTEAKNQALEAIAQAIEAATPEILAANRADCEAAKADGLSNAFFLIGSDLVGNLLESTVVFQSAVHRISELVDLVFKAGESFGLRGIQLLDVL